MNKENTQVEFTLQGIKTEQFAILEENYSHKKEADLGTEIQVKLDQKNRQIVVFLGLEFLQGKKVFMKIQISCYFTVAENAWKGFIRHESSKLVIPKGLLAHLAMITTDTTRGVLFAKTESTQFSKFIVPALNIAEMINEDISFDLIVD